MYNLGVRVDRNAPVVVDITPVATAVNLCNLTLLQSICNEPNDLYEVITLFEWGLKDLSNDVIQFAIRRGKNINEMDDSRNTLLHQYIRKNDFESVASLVSIGADLTLKNSDNLTPVEYAEHLVAKGKLDGNFLEGLIDVIENPMMDLMSI
jgi:ankyrin repeat protein